MRAARWYRKAAVQGNAEAAARLGHLYLRGEGVPKDRDRAFYWYLKAWKEGSARAIEALKAYGKKGTACYVPPT